MHIDTKHLAKQGIEVLGISIWIAGATAVSGGDVEIAVRTETDPAGFMIGTTRRLIDREHQRVAVSISDVRVTRNVISANFRVAVQIDQVDVEIAVLREV